MMPGPGDVEPLKESPMALGTVGWNDDGGTFYEAGAADNDGHTLVRVTLFRGRDPTQPKVDGLAQGQKLLCRMGGGFFRVPPRGTQVLVAIPEPFGRIPGASVIVTALDATSGAPIYGNIKPGEVCIGTPGSASRLIMKNSGEIVLLATSDNTAGGKSLSVEFGPSGFKVTHMKGGFSIDAEGNVTLTSSTAALTLTAAGDGGLQGKRVSIQGSLVAVAGSMATCIGKDCLPVLAGAPPLVTTALRGTTGLTAVPSTNVFIGG